MATRALSIERNNRRTRWLHAGVYVTVLLLLATGWWLALGQEGKPSILAQATDISDTDLHTYLGWTFAGVAGLGLVAGWRAALTLIRDSVRFRRNDVSWLVNWPRAIATGRFGRHEGHFDPGQRMANVVMILLLAALIGSGIGLVLVSGGQAFVWYDRVHRWATYLLTPVILGHIIIAAGILPGYRGVWRAMHLGGRLRRQDAGRVWPGWLERTTAEVSIDTEAADGPQEAGTAAESTDTPPEARDVSAPTPPGPRHRARRRTDETGSE